MDDIAIIREILAVTHVPVVAQLQWEKLQGLLRSVCDRLAAHTERLEKAEALAKHFEALKEETREACRNTANECREFTEIQVQKQAEKLEAHAKATGDRLLTVQKGMEENHAILKQVRNEVTGLVGKVEPLPKKVEELETASKAANEGLEEVQGKIKEHQENLLKQGEAFQAQFERHEAEQMGAVRVLTEELENLQTDVISHNERLQKLETDVEDCRFQLQEETSTHTIEIETLNKYCQALRHDVDTKLAVPELKPGQRRPSAVMQDLGNAVTDLQSRLQAKADLVALDQIGQANRDAVQRLTAVVDDLRHQMRRGTSAVPISQTQRRSSKLSAIFQSTGPKGMVTDYIADEVREALRTHDRLLDEMHRDMGYLGKSLIIMSGHDKNFNRFLLPKENPPPAPPSQPGEPNTAPDANTDANTGDPNSQPPPPPPPPPPVPPIEPTYEEMFYSFERALRTHKIHPKEDMAQFQQLEGLVSTLKAEKAEKKEMQRIARMVREFMEQPEHAVFTGKPLMGFKCMSCDQDIERLNPARADYIAHSGMPKQLPSMMSAGRIFAPTGTPRTPRLSSQRLSTATMNGGPYSARLPRRSWSAGNPANLTKPL